MTIKFNTKEPYRLLLSRLAYYPSGREFPTHLNDDNTEIYLASIDEVYETHSVKKLEIALDIIFSNYKRHIGEKGTAHGDLKLAICRRDFFEVAILLHGLRTYNGDSEFRDEESYAFPDELFDDLLNKQD